MIVRSLPDVDRDLLLHAIHSEEVNLPFSQPPNTFFFNSGSSSLLFFLNMFGEGKRVGLQVFTCSSVFDTVKRAKDIPIFMDIDKDFFTTNYDIVYNYINTIDILILSHLCGIPNPDYISIKELCKQKKVILIDDLCQTYHARVGDSLLEDLSDNYFYSFFYDKPISAASGGMLKLTSEFYQRAIDRYYSIDKDTESHGRRLLRKLFWMNRLLAPEFYKKDFRNDSLWEEFLLSYYPISWSIGLLRCLLYSITGRVFCKLGLKASRLPLRRMSDVQLGYIINRLNAFRNNNYSLLSYCKKHKIPIPKYLTDSRIECSLAKRCIISDNPGIRKEGVEIALYNWPHLICENETEYPEAVSVVRDCINIPLWCDDILESV